MHGEVGDEMRTYSGGGVLRCGERRKWILYSMLATKRYEMMVKLRVRVEDASRGKCHLIEMVDPVRFRDFPSNFNQISSKSPTSPHYATILHSACHFIPSSNATSFIIVSTDAYCLHTFLTVSSLHPDPFLSCVP